MYLCSAKASLIAQLVNNPPAMQETWVQSLGGKIPWRRERLPTPVFWPGEFHGLYSLWGHKESDTTERLSFHIGQWKTQDQSSVNHGFTCKFTDWVGQSRGWGLLASSLILKILFYIGVWLMNNVLLISGAQQSDSVLHIHLYILFQVLFPFRLLKSVE